MARDKEEDDLYDEDFDFVDDDDFDDDESEEENDEEEEEVVAKKPKKAAPRKSAKSPKKKAAKASPRKRVSRKAAEEESAEEEPEFSEVDVEDVQAEADDSETEESLDEFGRPAPVANYVVHIYEHRKFKRTIDRDFTPEDGDAFATDYNRYAKSYGRMAVAGKKDVPPKKSVEMPAHRPPKTDGDSTPW